MSFEEVLARKKQLIDDSIKQLLSIQTFLNQKAEHIQLGMRAKHGDISLITLPERKIVVSDSLLGTDVEGDTSTAAQFALRLKKLFSLYDSFGSRISVEALQEKEFSRYDRYFAYCPEHAESFDEVLPGGTYLQAFCIGAWDKLPEVYGKILTYANQHNLELCGYAYEEGLNEMSLSNMGGLDGNAISHMEDYITRINIQVK